jgi:hypothetical protein
MAEQTKSNLTTPEVKPEVKAVETKPADVKAEAPKKTTTKKTPGRKPAAKKTAAAKAPAAAKTTTRKTTTRKTTSKRASTPRKSASSELIQFEFAGKTYTTDELTKKAKEFWKSGLKKRAGDLKSMKLYVKPAESRVYCVFNNDIQDVFFEI